MTDSNSSSSPEPQLIDTKLIFRNFAISPATRESIYRRLLLLQRHYGRIIQCTVAVGTPSRRQHKGKQYSVRVSLLFPRGRVLTTRSQMVIASRPGLEVAIHDAFDAARKQLRRQVERRRGRETAARGIGLRKLPAATRDRVGAGDSTWRRAPRGTRLGLRAETAEQEAQSELANRRRKKAA